MLSLLFFVIYALPQATTIERDIPKDLPAEDIIAFKDVVKDVPIDVINSAKRSTILSSVSYCSQQNITKRICYPHCLDKAFQSLQNVKVTEDGNDFWYTGYDAGTNEIMIVFRGSSNVQQWLENFDAFELVHLSTMWGGEAKVHRGWLNDVIRRMPKISQDMNSLLTLFPSADIHFTGHSSGGVYAMLSAILSLREGFLVQRNIPASRVSVTSIASPRVGNDEFVGFWDSIGFKYSWRVAKGADLVTLVPPEFLNYKHASKEIYMNSNPGADSKPVFCSEDSFSSVKGSCDRRNSWIEILFRDNAPQFISDQHVNYLGVRVGGFKC